MKAPRKSKSYETLEFIDDFLFCKILTSDLDLAKELLEIILNTEIREVKIAEPQKSLKFTPNDHGVRFDVYVKDADNVVYDIEMQTTEERDLGKRARYYQGMIDLNLLESGKHFSDLNKSFVIFILKHCPESAICLKSKLRIFSFMGSIIRYAKNYFKNSFFILTAHETCNIMQCGS